MSSKVHFTKYIIVRLATAAVLILSLFFMTMYMIGFDRREIMMVSVWVIASLFLFMLVIWRGSKKIQKALNTLNGYLKNPDNLDDAEVSKHFWTKEFEEMNHNLLKALKKAKKRDNIKQRYNAKLKLKNRQRADMISAIAHELRNPIASIMGYSQTLHEEPDIPPVLRNKFLEKIYNNGNKIEMLLGRLILWNKFESGQATLHQSSFDLYALAQEVKRSLEEKYKNRQILLDGQTYMVYADRTLVEVVLKNLMENALKYSKEDIHVTVTSDCGVSVRDHGVGISEEDIQKVTKKFYRSGTHSWDNSMGLGLSIVKTILKLHGSQLHIESKLHEGSTFSFRLSCHSDDKKS